MMDLLKEFGARVESTEVTMRWCLLLIGHAIMIEMKQNALHKL